MKVYGCLFNGHFTTGTAVVVAKNKREGRKALSARLKEELLELCAVDKLFWIDTDNPRVVIMDDGDEYL